MKIRTGFVANSSSSSFIIAGNCFNYNLDTIKSLYEKYDVDFKTLEYSDDYETLEEYIKSDLYYSVENLATEVKMDYEVDSESGYFYFGYSLDQNNIDTVIGKANKAKEVFGGDVKIHSGSIYN